MSDEEQQGSTPERALWSLADLCAGLGLSFRDLESLRQWRSLPKLIATRDGVDLYEENELIAWAMGAPRL